MENSSNQKTRFVRKQYLINKGFQIKMMLSLVLVVIGTICGAHIIALGYMKVMQNSPVTTADVQTLVSGFNVGALMNMLWLPAGLTFLLGVVFVLAFGLFYSHRIAGPLFNLKRQLQNVGDGKLNMVMHFRGKDEFHDVASTFNQMVAGLNQRHAAFKKALAELPEPGRRKIERTWGELFTLAEPETVEREKAV